MHNTKIIRMHYNKLCIIILYGLFNCVTIFFKSTFKLGKLRKSNFWSLPNLQKPISPFWVGAYLFQRGTYTLIFPALPHSLPYLWSNNQTKQNLHSLTRTHTHTHTEWSIKKKWHLWRSKLVVWDALQFPQPDYQESSTSTLPPPPPSKVANPEP